MTFKKIRQLVRREMIKKRNYIVSLPKKKPEEREEK